MFIFGAGGLAKEVFFLLSDLGYSDRMKGFLVSSDKYLNSKNEIFGKQVLAVSHLNEDRFELVIAIGDTRARQKIKRSVELLNIHYPSFIHPMAKYSEWTTFGKGSLVMCGAIITCDVEIGDFCVIDRSCNIGHDSKIGDYCHICPGAIISGNVEIMENVFIGAGAVIRENVSIASNVVIGMGSVVLNSIYEAGVYAGNPARKIR